MSFAVWQKRPSFAFAPEDREQIYQVGELFVVTDDPARATQAEIDAVLNPPKAPRQQSLAERVLIAKGLATRADFDAEESRR